MKGILARKVGMTQIYDDEGHVVPITVVEAGPCKITALRTKERDGYSAVQLGFGTRNMKNINKSVKSHISAAGYTTDAPAWIKEIRLDADSEANIGDSVSANIFNVGDFIDVSGNTKGRGFQGVVKRHGFAGGRASHGGDWLRRGGSIGMCVNPGKIYKGRKMPGHMGNAKITTQNLKVVTIKEDENLLAIKGSVPGPNGGFLIITEAKKRKAISG